MRRIADALMALQQHGSGDYIGWEMKCPCNLPNVVDQLQHVASNLEDDLEQWKHEIQEQRDQFYELNYYTTQQLLLLRKELGRLQEPRENTVKPEAMALLLSISRDVSGDVMKEYVLDVTHKEQQKVMALASTIAQAEDHVSFTDQPTEQSAQLPEPVDPTISAVVIDLLESEATKTSTPRAIQKEDDLGIEQKAILANIRNNFGCHKQLILLAFERCENSCDPHAVTAWCMNNQSKYMYDDDDDDDEEEEEEEEEEPFTETRNNSSKNNYSMKEDTESSIEVEASINEPAEEMVTVEERIAVDEHHPVVKELLELDYPLEQCLQAAERYPDDSQAAFEYLNELSGKKSTVKLFSVDVNSSRTSVASEIPSHDSR